MSQAGRRAPVRAPRYDHLMLAPNGERRRFTIDEVARMVDAGVLGEDEPLELIEGELIVVPPQGPEHASRVSAITTLLARRYLHHVIRSQLPLVVGDDSLPEPDAAVIRGADSTFTSRHPRGDEAVLVIEITRSSHAIDRGKARLYAKGGAPLYWLVDLAARRIEERSQPIAGEYRVTRVYGAGDEIALPELGETVPVSTLLGPE